MIGTRSDEREQGYESAGDRRQRRDRHRPRRGLDDDRATRSCSPAARPRPGAPRRKSSPPAPRSRAPSPRGCGSRPTPRTSPTATSSSRRSIEEVEPKGELLATVAEACPNADLATTTSSLSIAEIAGAAGIAGRLFGLHVFNPVPRMKLVEVCFPDGAEEAREKALAWCAALGKTAVEVPDQAGFVVNRLLFPYLFDAVRHDRADRHGGGRGRHLHEARRRPPDGPAGPARLRRPRRRRGDRRRPLRRLLRGRPQAAGADGRDGRRREAGPQERRRLLQYD